VGDQPVALRLGAQVLADLTWPGHLLGGGAGEVNGRGARGVR
jgi:hypothetical protein